MRVSRIELDGVTTHAGTVLDLPETGLVLVSGSNGSGKSSLVQAVPWTIWGKSLSGAKLWSGKKGHTAATVDGVPYRRGQKKPKISWPGMPEYEKDSFAQDELTRRFGELDHWRRSCVVSSQDIATFATAKDSDRKRMLEDTAGSALLEGAHRVALDRVKSVSTELTRVEQDLASCRASIARLEAILASPAPEMPPEEESEEPDLGDIQAKKAELDAKSEKLKTEEVQGLAEESRAEKAKLEKRIAELQEVLRSAQQDLRQTEQAMAHCKSSGQEAKKRSEGAEEAKGKVLNTGVCPTCEQKLPTPEDLVEKYESERCQALSDLAGFREDYKGLKEEAAELRESIEDIAGKVQTVQGELEEYRAVEREAAARRQAQKQAEEDLWKARQALSREVEARKQAVKRAKEAAKHARQAVENALRQRALAEKQLAELQAQLVDLESRTATKEEQLAIAKDAAKTLSTRGIRAHILDGLIQAIQDEANLWLEMICGDRLRLELKAFGEKADGGRKDQVSFDVIGAGGGHGYQAASGGERRRIDIAVTLALALVSEAASGREGSTVFLDEPLDALDRDGIESTVEALVELAKDRCVLVIAHEAVDALHRRADQHYVVHREDCRARLERVV